MNTINDSSTAVAPAVPGVTPQLALRIVHPDLGERIASLAFGKCTVGSSSRCQIQLHSQEVKPLHCLVVHEPSGTVVTRWAPNSLLNGHEFSTAKFDVGDCLQLGDVQVQLVAQDDLLVFEQEAFHAAVQESNNGTETYSARTKASTEAMSIANAGSPTKEKTNYLITKLQTAKVNSRVRCRKLIASLRDLRTEADTFANQIGSLQEQLNQSLHEREQISDELNQMRTEFSQREVQINKEIDCLNAELTRAHDESKKSEATVQHHAAQCEQLRGELAALNGERDELRQLLSSSDEQHSRLGAEINDKEHYITELQEQLEEARTAIELAENNTAEQAGICEQLQEELQVLQHEREESFAVREEQQQLLSSLEETVAQRGSRIDDLTSELEYIRELARSAEERYSEQAAACDQSRADLEGFQAEHEKLLGTVDDLQQQQTEKNQSLAECDHRINELLQEVGQVREALSSAEERGNQQNHACQELQSALDGLQQECDHLRNEKTDFEAKQEEWDETLAKRDVQLGELTQELGHVRSENEQFERRDGERQAELEELHCKLQKLREHCDQLSAERSEHETQRQDWEATLADKERQFEELRVELQGAQDAARDSEQQRVANIQKLEQIEQEFAEMRNEHENLVDSQAQHEECRQQLELSLVERDRRIQALQAENERVCEVLETFEAGAFEHVDARKKLESELDAIRQHRDELAAEQSERDGRIQELERALQDRDQQVEQWNARIAESDRRREEMESEVAIKLSAMEQADAEVGELRDRCEQLSEENASKTNHAAELQTALTDQRQAVEKLNHELEIAHRQSQEFETELESRTQEYENLQNEQVELQTYCDKLEAEREGDSQRRQGLDYEIAQRQQRVEMFEADLKSVREELQQSRERTVQLEKLQSAAEEEITALKATLDDRKAQASEDCEADASLIEEREELSRALEEARKELAGLRQQSGEGCSQPEGSAELVAATQEEKAALEQELQQQSACIDQLTSELENIKTKLVDGQTHVRQLEAQCEQSQTELAEARECLRSAEVLLQNRVSVPSDKNTNPETSSADADTHAQVPPAWVVSENNSNLTKEKTSEVEEEPAEEYTPTSFIDHCQHTLEDDVDPGAVPLIAETGERLPAVGGVPDVDGDDQESDDDALEAYMSSMMRRVRGEISFEEPTTLYSSSQNGEAHGLMKACTALVDAMAEPASSSGELDQDETTIEPLDLDNLKLSSSKPALPTNINAMRELANNSARQAIAKHYKRRYLESAFSKLAVCVIATALSIYALLTAESYVSFWSLGGCVAGAVGATWGFRLLGVLLEAIRVGTNEPHEAEILLEEEPLTVAYEAETESDDQD